MKPTILIKNCLHKRVLLNSSKIGLSICPLEAIICELSPSQEFFCIKDVVNGHRKMWYNINDYYVLEVLNQEALEVI